MTVWPVVEALSDIESKCDADHYHGEHCNGLGWHDPSNQYKKVDVDPETILAELSKKLGE